MHKEYRSHYSGHLGREMPFNKYGHAGTPFIVFPSSGGSKDEYEAFLMIQTLASFIEKGHIQFYTPSSVDNESWNASFKSPHDKAHTHNQYDRYLVEELVPLIRYESNWQGKIGATGASMGGFHSLLFALRHPDTVGITIAQSGIYDARFFTGDFGDDLLVYENSVVDFLSNMTDPWYLDQYRQNHYLIAVGQGDWEAPHLASTRQLKDVFQSKDIPAWFDIQGNDIPHDWTAWRDQIYVYINSLVGQGVI